MIGQAISLEGKKYNVIILAGGNGSRMGEQSDYIPKALSIIGNGRAVDYIIERYINVAHKFIIGTGKHADLLETYLEGRFKNLHMEFSRESRLKNNAISAMYCLDHADSDFGTIILFCDLLVISNTVIRDDRFLVASEHTTGVVGTFRHKDRFGRGILGHFVFGDTPLLKSVAYTGFVRNKLNDLTENLVLPYNIQKPFEVEECEKVFEFGNEEDLATVRRLWEES